MRNEPVKSYAVHTLRAAAHRRRLNRFFFFFLETNPRRHTRTRGISIANNDIIIITISTLGSLWNDTVTDKTMERKTTRRIRRVGPMHHNAAPATRILSTLTHGPYGNNARRNVSQSAPGEKIKISNASPSPSSSWRPFQEPVETRAKRHTGGVINDRPSRKRRVYACFFHKNHRHTESTCTVSHASLERPPRFLGFPVKLVSPAALMLYYNMHDGVRLKSRRHTRDVPIGHFGHHVRPATYGERERKGGGGPRCPRTDFQVVHHTRWVKVAFGEAISSIVCVIDFLTNTPTKPRNIILL